MKNFLEYSKPEREKRLVIVAQWTRLETEVCEAPLCKNTLTEYPCVEFLDCPVCGKMLCPDCFGDPNATIAWKEHSNYLCCKNCTVLHTEEREALLALRVQLDQF